MGKEEEERKGKGKRKGEGKKQGKRKGKKEERKGSGSKKGREKEEKKGKKKRIRRGKEKRKRARKEKRKERGKGRGKGGGRHFNAVLFDFFQRFLTKYNALSLFSKFFATPSRILTYSDSLQTYSALDSSETETKPNPCNSRPYLNPESESTSLT